MSYNRRLMQKRGGRIKNNFIDNITIRRSNVSANVQHTSQIRSNISNSFNPDNNIQNTLDFYEDHKTLYILCKYYLGNFVTIKTETEEFNGVLRAVSPNGDFCLTEATVFLNRNEGLSRNDKFKMIPIKDIKIVEAKNVDSNHNITTLDHDQILTDEEIVKRRRSNQGTDHNQYYLNGTVDIQLTPFYDSSVPLEDNCLNASKAGPHWFPPEEMFEKNKISFNVKSTYNENLEGYTTQLNKEDPNFERDLIIAKKKALEIEKDRDATHDDLENDEEENEEELFCSISRTSESHRNVTENKVVNSLTKPVYQQIRKYPDHSSSSSQDAADQKHNLNPNAREFTPISSSASYGDANNISMQMNSLNIQNLNNYPNIIHHQSFIPYSIPVMIPQHMPNPLPVIQNPSMDQFIIPRPNLIPNYSLPPFIVPNQCQISFDPNLMAPLSNSRLDNNFQSASFSSHTDIDFSNEYAIRNEGNELENVPVSEDLKKEESDSLKRINSSEFHNEKIMRAGDPPSSLQESSNHNLEVNDQMANFQKINSVNSNTQRMYNQVVAGNHPQAYIVPTNITHGVRNVGNYPQIMSNQISYIPNYFPRQPFVIPNMMPANPTQIHQNVPVQMKSITTTQTPNFPPGFQSTPSFVPVMNSQINSQNFHTILPGYPQPISTVINGHVQIPFQHNVPPFQSFTQFITPIQPCNYFTQMPPPAPQPN